MAEHLTNGQIAICQGAFKQFDSDGDEKLSADELKRAVETLGLNREGLPELDDDVSVGFPEFLMVVVHLGLGQPVDWQKEFPEKCRY